MEGSRLYQQLMAAAKDYFITSLSDQHNSEREREGERKGKRKGEGEGEGDKEEEEEEDNWLENFRYMYSSKLTFTFFGKINFYVNVVIFVNHFVM